MPQEDSNNVVMVLPYRKRSYIKNYHPINLLSMIYKFFTKVLVTRLESVLDSAQFGEIGFQRTLSTMARTPIVKGTLKETLGM